MRVGIVFLCATVTACAQRDQQRTVSKTAIAVAVADTSPTSALVADSRPAPEVWSPSPLPDPSDTTAQGFPTESALLRWVRRYPPDSFPELSRPVRDSLVSRGCQVPTPGYRTNVITGAFTAKGAVEWAVVCSVHDTSQILVMNAANGVVVDSLRRSADSNWIQSDVGKRWLFSRAIALVPMSTLNIVPADTTDEDVVYFGAVLPKPIDHDGIDQAFLDKASTMFYFAQGKWFEVGTSD